MPKKRKVIESPTDDLIFRRELIGSYLRQVRLHLGLSFRELQAQSGVTATEIFNIETDKQDCRLETFVRICSALGSSSGTILDDLLLSNAGLYNRIVLEDASFKTMVRSMGIPTKYVQSMAESVASCCAFASILIRCGNPERRATSMDYPTSDLREAYLNFSRRLMKMKHGLERMSILTALKSRPVDELKNQKLYAEAFFAELAEQLQTPKAKRKKPLMAWSPWVVQPFEWVS